MLMNLFKGVLMLQKRMDFDKSKSKETPLPKSSIPKMQPTHGKQEKQILFEVYKQLKQL